MRVRPLHPALFCPRGLCWTGHWCSKPERAGSTPAGGLTSRESSVRSHSCFDGTDIHSHESPRDGDSLDRVQIHTGEWPESLIRLPDTFTAKIAVNFQTGCWEWQGSRATNGGYGRYWDSAQKKPVMAHVYAFTTLKGEVPSDRELHHRCENRLCVNPGHLVIVTRGENVRHTERVVSEVCRHGHLRSEHSRRDKRGKLVCMACERERFTKASVSGTKRASNPR